MDRYQVDPKRALVAVKTFLSSLTALEASEEFAAARLKREELNEKIEKEYEVRSALIRQHTRLEVALGRSSFWTRGACFEALHAFRSGHPDIPSDRHGFHLHRRHAFSLGAGLNYEPCGVVSDAREKAQRERDFLSMVLNDPLLVEEQRLIDYARYESGGALTEVRSACGL